MNDPVLALTNMATWNGWDWLVFSLLMLLVGGIVRLPAWFLIDMIRHDRRFKVEMFEESYPRRPPCTGYTDKEWRKWKRQYEKGRRNR